MEDFVPYDLYLKLKEKGFDTKKYPNYLYYNEDLVKVKDHYNISPYEYAPTISQVLKWLRDRNIHIEPFLVNAETVQYKLNIMGWNGKFFCSIYNSLLEDANNKTITTYQSYEQVALAGIEYVIDNNLI